MSKNSTASRNRTLKLNEEDISLYSKNLISIKSKAPVNKILNKTINQDIFDAIEFLPNSFIDLLIIDPPYNMNKKFDIH